jgi:probable phosphoglycerate mutase
VTTILLARHGETDWNVERRFQGWADPPLNARGREQARRLAAEVVAGPLVAAVYASDLRRASETAEIVARELGLEVELTPALREIDVGELTGLTVEEIDASFPGWRERMDERGDAWNRGEPVEQMSRRVLAALARIEQAHEGERVLVVAHGGTVRAALAAADGLDIVTHRRVWPGPAANCALFALAVECATFRRLD